MESHSAPNTNVLSSHEKMWRNLKGISLSKKSQSEKVTHYMMSYINTTFWKR